MPAILRRALVHVLKLKEGFVRQILPLALPYVFRFGTGSPGSSELVFQSLVTVIAPKRIRHLEPFLEGHDFLVVVEVVFIDAMKVQTSAQRSLSLHSSLSRPSRQVQAFTCFAASSS